MNMKMKHVSMVLPILLLSVGAIACGSTTRGDASVTHNESEEAVFTPTSYRSTKSVPYMKDTSRAAPYRPVCATYK